MYSNKLDTEHLAVKMSGLVHIFASYRKTKKKNPSLSALSIVMDECCPMPLLQISFFLRAQVYEAYGQTECTAGCTYTTPGDWTSGEPQV